MKTANTDAVLGQSIINELTDRGLMIKMTDRSKASDDEKIAKLTPLFAEILETLGYDLADEELADTPRRVAKMWTNDMFTAYKAHNFPKCTSFDNRGNGFTDEMVIVKDIKAVSSCAHHLIVTDTTVDIAYRPGKKMIGLSKINRLVQFLAKNPTSQETLGKAIAVAVSRITESDDVIVRIAGVHFCVKARGIRDTDSSTVTMAALGVFAEPNSSLRKEFTAALTK